MKPDSDPSATVIVVRELLRTPAFRELIKANLQAADAEDARALAHTLIWEDVDVSLGAASRLSLVVNAMVQVLGELNGLLEQASPRVRRAFFAGLAEEVDGDGVREQVVRLLENLHVLLWEDEEIQAGVGGWLAVVANHGLEQLARMHREDPRRLAEPMRAVVGELLPRLDFGLVRRGIVALADSSAEVLPGAVGGITGNAVLMANTLACLPSVVNAALAVGARAVASAELPGEVLASALFKLLQRVDTGHLAALMDALGARLLDLHQGSLVLGRHEPRLRAVLTVVLQDLLRDLDRDQLARVVVALGEDAGTLARVAGDLLMRDPELAGQAAAAALDAADAATHGAADALGSLGQLPDRELSRLAERLRRDQPTHAAQLVNEAVTLILRVTEADPEGSARAVDGFIDALDTEALGRVARRLLGPALTRRLDTITPARAGQALGNLLGRAADTLEQHPTLVRDVVDQALADADPARTRALVDNAMGQVKEAVGHRPELVKALVQPLVSTLGALLWEYMRTLGQKTDEPNEPPEDTEPGPGLRRRLWRRIRSRG